MAISSDLKLIFVVSLALMLSACGGVNYAPVIKPVVPVSKPGRYYVRPGDTLYSIAWAYGLDYKKLAQMNGIKNDEHIQPNQYLIVNPAYVPRSVRGSSSKTYAKRTIKTRTVKTVRTKASMKIHTVKLPRVSSWHWPAEGRVIGRYAPWKGNKGINIAGRAGSPIRAAAAGIVVYAGSGLPAYGKLIILKDSSIYLSAYAHNQRILVREGQRVRQGQKIAEMGSTGTDKTMLHFEIRKNGKPLNPLLYLKK